MDALKKDASSDAIPQVTAMTRKKEILQYFIQGLGDVLLVFPDTDYSAFVPRKTASAEAWERISDHLAKSLFLEAARIHVGKDELDRLALELQNITANRSTNVPDLDLEPLPHPVVIKERRRRDRQREGT